MTAMADDCGFRRSRSPVPVRPWRSPLDDIAVLHTGEESPASGVIYAPRNGRIDELEISVLAGGFVRLVPYPGKEHIVQFVAD